MYVFYIILGSIEILLLFYFGFTSIYNFLLSLAGLFPVRPVKSGNSLKNKIAVLIPAYKEDQVILQTTKSAIEQSYPSIHFQVFVIADQLESSTIQELEKLPVEVIQVNFDKSTKVKALNAAFDSIQSDFQIGLVLDADNLIEPDFLKKVNDLFNAGYEAIQGQRMPKNKESQMSFLDGLSEAINNHIVRKGTCNLGGSSAIVGSGFAVSFELLKNLLSKMDSVGGFDKELEILLLKGKVKTKYFPDLKLFDEKVSNTSDFKNQRKRWISSQFFYLRKYAGDSFSYLSKGEWAFFNSAFLRYAQLPRFINLVLLFLISGAFVLIEIFSNYGLVNWWVWLIVFLAMFLSIILAIPGEYYNFRLIKAVLKLPKTFFVMFLLLFKLKGANDRFIHTPHSEGKAGEREK